MDITAPVAGRIADLRVEPGAHVVAGETVAILEVMKMEHPVTATVPGVVTVVKVSVGDAVDAGDLLATLDPSESEPGEQVGEETPDLAALEEVMERHDATLDAARPEAVAARHERGSSIVASRAWPGRAAASTSPPLSRSTTSSTPPTPDAGSPRCWWVETPSVNRSFRLPKGNLHRKVLQSPTWVGGRPMRSLRVSWRSLTMRWAISSAECISHMAVWEPSE